MAETTVVEPGIPSTAPAQEVVADPFSLDENSLVSLAPEQRAALDPILSGWRERAKQEIERTSKSSEERFAPLKEKATALDQLVNWAPFQNWWNLQQQAIAQQVPVGTPQSKPQDFATPEEWSQAVLDASNGNAERLQNIQARMFATMATPVVQQLQSRQQEIDTKVEMRDLMESHPDYKELDQIGLDAKGEGTSLLEHCLNWAESQRKPLEEGYAMARRWADAMGAKKQAEAMGMVQAKRDSVMAGPSTASGAGQVVYVDSLQEAIRKTMEAQLEGRKDVRYEVKTNAK